MEEREDRIENCEKFLKKKCPTNWRIIIDLCRRRRSVSNKQQTISQDTSYSGKTACTCQKIYILHDTTKSRTGSVKWTVGTKAHHDRKIFQSIWGRSSNNRSEMTKCRWNWWMILWNEDDKKWWVEPYWLKNEHCSSCALWLIILWLASYFIAENRSEKNSAWTSQRLWNNEPLNVKTNTTHLICSLPISNAKNLIKTIPECRHGIRCILTTTIYMLQVTPCCSLCSHWIRSFFTSP